MNINKTFERILFAIVAAMLVVGILAVIVPLFERLILPELIDLWFLINAIKG